MLKTQMEAELLADRGGVARRREALRLEHDAVTRLVVVALEEVDLERVKAATGRRPDVLARGVEPSQPRASHRRIVVPRESRIAGPLAGGGDHRVHPMSRTPLRMSSARADWRLDQRTALPDQCLHSAEADGGPQGGIPGLTNADVAYCTNSGQTYGIDQKW